jgi:hypothetical protein
VAFPFLSQSSGRASRGTTSRSLIERHRGRRESFLLEVKSNKEKKKRNVNSTKKAEKADFFAFLSAKIDGFSDKYISPSTRIFPTRIQFQIRQSLGRRLVG